MSNRYLHDEMGLERALLDLGRDLDLPDSPHMSTRVKARIQGSVPERRWFPTRSFALVAASLAVILAGALAVSPAAREAVADLLGIGGVRIDVTESPSPTATVAEGPVGERLNLGDPVTLEEAGAETGFVVALPAELGTPDEVYLSRFPTDMVSLIYRPRSGLGRTEETGLGLLLTEFRASVDEDLIVKTVDAFGAKVEPVDVNGNLGYWVSGTHSILILLPDDRAVEDPIRLAGPTLVWESGGVTYRIESSLSKAETLRVARSVP